MYGLYGGINNFKTAKEVAQGTLTIALFSYKLVCIETNSYETLATIALIGLCNTRTAGGRVFVSSNTLRGHFYKNVEKYIPGYYNKHGQWVGGYVDSDRKRALWYYILKLLLIFPIRRTSRRG